jgi:TIR domain
MRRILLISAADAGALTNRASALIRERLPKDIQIDTTGELPDGAKFLVIVFVLSPTSITDQAAVRIAEEAARRGFPVIPLVEDIATYSFASMPPGTEVLSSRNAVGLNPNEDRFLDSVRGHLGLESFVGHRQVFISYRRSDAERVALKIEDFLWSRRCVPFLDTIQIEGGAVVQDQVIKALNQKDFVVYIDSPDAGKSPWVLAELTEALSQRIPVCMVRLDVGRVHHDLISNVPSMVWDETNARTLDTLMSMISRGIAERVGLDERATRTIRDLAEAHHLRVEEIEGHRRRAQLTGHGKTIRIEWEDAPVSLERLHRLYELHRRAPPSDLAIYVCGDHTLFPPTRLAIGWASGANPLRVLTMAGLGLELARCLAPNS